MATISSALILKEITKTFPNLLKKLWMFSDEVVVVVNDDMDKKSINWLLKEKCRVITLKWKRDFSEARNLSFFEATKDYIFWCDADDSIDHPEKMREVVETMAENGVDWLVLDYIYARDEYGNVIARHSKQRVFKKGTVKWEKTVHENPVPTCPIVASDNKEINIIHLRDFKAEIESSNRNLEILMAEYEKDQEETDPRTLLYIGNTLYGLQRLEEAIEFYRKFVGASGWDEERYLAMHYLANCLAKVDRVAEAINICLEATKLYPEWSTAYFDLGEFYLQTGEFKKSQKWLEVGFGAKRPETLLATSDVEYEIDPWGRYCWALLQQGKIREAEQALERLLLVADPDMPEVKELTEKVQELSQTKDYIESFTVVANAWALRSKSKVKALFENIPTELAGYPHVVSLRNELVPPRQWEQDELAIYCPPAFEKWGEPSVLSGIGGSEEAVVYLSRALTKLGWKVTVFNDCGTMEGVFNGVTYRNYYEFNPKDRFNVLISWRTPELFVMDKIRAKKKWVWLHDVPATKYTREMIDSFDKLIVLSKYHRSLVPEVPDEKIMISSNGIVPEQFEGPIEKVERTMIYSSSYDRGLECLLKEIMPMVWRKMPDMVLHVAYGWQTFDKINASNPKALAWKVEMEQLMDHPKIIHHGRLGHQELADLMKLTKIHVYPTEFPEINCITVQKTQCAGCVPVTTNFAALNEFNKFGLKIDTDKIYSDKKKQKEFVEQIIYASEIMNSSESKRQKAIKEFSWEQTARQWDEEARK